MSATIDLSDATIRPRPAAPDANAAKRSLLGLSREEMGAALIEAGIPAKQAKMRVQQLWHWLYVRGVSDFGQMANVSKDLRAAREPKTSATIVCPTTTMGQVQIPAGPEVLRTEP